MDADGQWAEGLAGALCASASFVQHFGTCLGLCPWKWVSASLQCVPNGSIHVLDVGEWMVGGVSRLSVNIHLCGCDPNLPRYLCQILVKKQSLGIVWNSLFGGVIITIMIVMIECCFIWLSLESPSWIAEILHTKAVIIHSKYISAGTSDLMNCHFSDEKPLIWRLEFLLSQQPGHGGTEYCVTGSSRSTTSEPRMSWRAGLVEGHQKVSRRYFANIIFISNFPVTKGFL